ncbi:MAG: hypothetical protein QOF38_3336 [Pseudonocardiales bacterium]|nr:hypothetical protein [Pseudonocardiales bacterium]
MHPNTRRVLRTAPLAVVLALSVGACASPWASGSNSTSTSSTAANKAANSADAPAVPVAAPAGNTPAAAVPAPGQPAPAAAGGADGLPPATALSAADQAEYCNRTSPLDVALPSEDGRRQPTADLKAQAQIWAELTSYTPAGLHNDVALLATDYQALADGSRTLPQVDGEVRTSFGRVVDYRNLICLTEEERQKQAGN